MKSVFYALVTVDMLILVYCYIFGASPCLLNTQIGFITSSLVMFGSALSYKSMVQSRLNAGAIPDTSRDTVDQLEDPFDLYDEPIVESEEEVKTLQEVVKEERANLKKHRRSFWETTKDAKASFSFYRLGAYLLLIMGFFYLNNNHVLDIAGYLFSMFIPPFVVVFMLMREK
jgi:hypothetical protein